MPGLSRLKMEFGQKRQISVCKKRKPTMVVKKATCQSNTRGRGRLRRIMR